VGENRARLIIERAATILTEIPLKGSVAAVLIGRSRTAARALDTITPADLLQQSRCDRFRTKLRQQSHWGERAENQADEAVKRRFLTPPRRPPINGT